MPSFVVDPVLCTTPETDDAERIRAWLVALEAWLDAAETSPFEWRHVLGSSRALHEQGRFPSFTSLRRAQGVSGADINTGGLLRRVTRFFQAEEHDLLAITAAKCVVVSEGLPAITPESVLNRNLPEARPPLTDALLCIACDKAAGQRFARDAHFVTLPLQGDDKELRVQGSVALIDPEEMSVRLGNSTLDSSFPFLWSPEDLTRFQHETVLSGGAEGLPSLIDSIAKRTFPDAARDAVLVGDHFWQSLEKCGILEDRFATGKLLDICAGIVANQHEQMNVGRRPIRKTEAPDSKQRTRDVDNARAWRLTITKQGAGYRLHYWDVPASPGRSATVELACVLRERDPVVIPGG